MKAAKLISTGAALLVGALMNPTNAPAQHAPSRLVRLAEIRIDPSQFGAYEAALREEIETSLRVEPGVISLYAVSVKGEPNQIRLFEIYAGEEAYQAHLQSEHFRKYKSRTAAMVQSLRLIETEPLLLGTK